MFFVHRADELVGIEHFVTLDELDVARGHFAFLVHGERKLARLVLGGLELHPLEIEDNVGHVLHHAGQGGEFMLRSGDLHRGNGGAFQRRKQHAAQ